MALASEFRMSFSFFCWMRAFLSLVFSSSDLASSAAEMDGWVGATSGSGSA